MDLILQRLKSKTYLLAILTALIGFAQANPQLIADTFKLSTTQLGWLMGGAGILGLIIREFTTKPLSEK
jgi:uncharacterized membrane protein